jgi:hypothetical protein
LRAIFPERGEDDEDEQDEEEEEEARDEDEIDRRVAALAVV